MRKIRMLLFPYLMKTKLKDQSGVSRTECLCLSARSSLSPAESRHRVPANGGAGFSFPSTAPDSKNQPGFRQLKQSRQLGRFCFLQHFAEPRQLPALARSRAGPKRGRGCALGGTWLCEGGLSSPGCGSLASAFSLASPGSPQRH